MNSEKNRIECINITKSFKVRGGAFSRPVTLKALDKVQIAVGKSETTGIAGESGCGKSTLGRIISALLTADSGELLFDGRPLSTLSKPEFASFRRKTQMIFQDPYSSLNPRMRIGDIIAEPFVIAGDKGATSPGSTVEKLMEKVGLSPDQKHRFPHQFSGGQRQRIGIARALAANPEIIVADEPVSSLDISVQAQILNLLQEMKREFDLSMVMISHDLSVLRHICDSMSIMYLGAIVETGKSGDIFDGFMHPYTEVLIAAIPGIRKREVKKPLLKGEIPSPLRIPEGCRFHTRCSYAGQICGKLEPLLEEKRPGHFVACHLSDSIFG